MIEYRDVGVEVDSYDQAGRSHSQQILRNITLTLGQRRIGVIGANGSGKSTLLKLVNGLMKATSGQVLVEGLDPARQGRQVRRLVGHVFTDPMAQLVMATPLEEVELSLRASMPDRTRRHERALALLASRGLAALANRSVHALSGGERQLVALTCVLAVDPKIVIADEPTTLLDLRNRMELSRAFDEMDQQLVCSTHDLDLAARMDRVLLVDAGQVVADGEPGKIIALYRETMSRATMSRAAGGQGIRV
ncbi:biotin transport system ATP-binding protein [Propionibacterium cyclohexanicum]|uniref:Biotin transport system ATP-binding protein n=1 Tax=Propionibacterium cyclohexanicum TaxID=64702 RepID=A0A1H9QUE9_9ACTN|nr:ABC transporter ATP-binding protein [Propionibacterium cyclohexanicum]SER64078.1 biotin transport system ATP-binding protein [Propionibacterium cyclohexanicum]